MVVKPAEPGRPAEPLRPPPDFDGVGVAKDLLRTIRSGALATLDRENGAPFASLVTIATDVDGSPLLLMSRLSATPSTSKPIRGPPSFSPKAAEATRSPIRA